MPGLTPIGELVYNSYAFDATSKAKVSVEYVYDDAGRTIMYQRHTLTVEAMVAEDPACDLTLEIIRRKLGEPARLLTFTNRGFGTTTAVGPGATEDVAWGPKPKVLSWESIGANRAAEIVWQVVFCIAICESPGAVAAGVMGLNYEIAWSIDRHGMTRRTISGHILISNNRTAPRSADEFLDRLAVKAVPGFERTTERHLSSDRSRLEFSYTDTQIPSRNPLPPLITWATGKHRTRWSLGNGSTSAFLKNSISCEFNPKLGVSPALAWQIFRDVCKQRFDAFALANKKFIIDEVEAEEDIWGTACGFSVSWRVISTLENLLKDSGIWKPLGFDWKLWNASVANAQGPRGLAGMVGGVDIIIDLCRGPIQQTVEPVGPPPATPYDISGGFKNTPPTPETSYLQYAMNVEPYRVRPVTRQAIMQAPDTESSSGMSEMGTQTSFKYPTGTSTPDIIQEGGQSRYGVRITGHAIRAGFEIPRPAVTKFGGETATERSGRFVSRATANALGVPVYSAAWDIDYALPATPKIVRMFANIKENIDEQGQAAQPVQ